MDRRTFIKLAAGGTGILLFPGLGLPAFAAQRIEKITRTNSEWGKLLTPEQYDVLRAEGTEYPYTSPLNHEKRSGMFVCVACEFPLFPSKFKFDSGTGWPSFFDVLPGHVETRKDVELMIPRTEYHCARCGGIDESIRPQSLNGLPARRYGVLEAAPKRAQCTVCQFRSATHPRRGGRSGFNGKLQEEIGKSIRPSPASCANSTRP